MLIESKARNSGSRLFVPFWQGEPQDTRWMSLSSQVAFTFVG